MNKENRLEYYKQEILKNMSVIENLKCKGMFHEHYPEIESNFWKYCDRKDLEALFRIHNVLCKLIDYHKGA